MCKGTCNGSMWSVAGVTVNERACAQRALDITDVETTLTKHSTLLISHLHSHRYSFQRLTEEGKKLMMMMMNE